MDKVSKTKISGQVVYTVEREVGDTEVIVGIFSSEDGAIKFINAQKRPIIYEYDEYMVDSLVGYVRR